MRSLLISLFAACSLLPGAWADSSSETWAVVVDQAIQKVAVLREGQPIREMPCSSGLPETPTPLGEFEVYNKDARKDIKEYGLVFLYWTQFKGIISFHSTPYDVNLKPIPGIVEKLGQPASHGCVRLTTQDAKWVYENVPLGAKVTVLGL